MSDLGQQIENRQLDQIGGEPLEGSGFENEVPDPSFEMAEQSVRQEVRHVE